MGKRQKIYTVALFGIAVLGLGFFGGWLGASSRLASGPLPQSSQTSKGQIASIRSSDTAVSAIASEVSPSVVSVSVTTQATGMTNNPYAYFFGYEPMPQQGAGTGIILNEDGLVMTNRHVVPAGTSSVSVTLSDGTVLDDVQVVGRTSSRDSLDIAFLKIGNKKGKQLTPAKLGDSSQMKVGDSVIAIGNTLGQFQNTVTTGIISGYGRSLQASDGAGGRLENLDDMFQTDAAINQGNSGGPLVNLAGEVIGINTAIASDSQSVGFAIPINNVKGLIGSVVDTGKLQRPYLGVYYIMLTDDVAKQYDLPVNRGAYIPKADNPEVASSVIVGGPADKAGVRPGDVITKIDGKSIDAKSSLSSILGKHKVGDNVKLEIVRDKKTQVLDAKLAAAPTS